MKNFFSIVFFASLTGIVLTVAIAGGQQPGKNEISIVDKVAVRKKIAIAVPEALLDTPRPELAQMAGTIRHVVLDDLSYHGMFNPVREEYYALIPRHDETRIPFDEWNSIGAEVLVLMRLKESEGRPTLEGRLYDTLSDRKMIFGKRYKGSVELARKMAHSLSDDIIYQLTGKKGVGLTKIAFVSDRTGNKEIFVMDYDGYGQTQITNNRTISLHPDWAPDQSRIALCSFIFGKPDLFLLGRWGGKPTLLFGKSGFNSAPAWSPDGQRVAFAASFQENVDIYTINPDGNGLKKVTNSPSIDTSPCWSPNGREIAFTSSRSGTPQIYITDVDGLNIRRLTYEGTYNESADWSPDGKYIIYAYGSGSSYDITIMDIATGQSRMLTENAGRNENPSWSSDGRQIAFSSNRTGKIQIYLMNADGSNQRAVTSDGNNSMPNWSSE
jgi:TolB protein